MAIDTTLQGRDLYLRSTDATGAVTRSFHRVWDPERFMKARRAEAEKLNADSLAKHGPTRASASQITREQFKAGD
jgi:hypothetical protein